MDIAGITGCCADVEDNDKDDDDNDAISGRDDKKSKNFEVFSPLCSQPQQMRPLFHTVLTLSLFILSLLFLSFLSLSFFCDVSLKNEKCCEQLTSVST